MTEDGFKGNTDHIDCLFCYFQSVPNVKWDKKDVFGMWAENALYDYV